MNSKQQSTLRAIFTNPVPMNLDFKRMESLFLALGAKLIEGDGSRVRFVLNDVVVSFHRPHPHKEAKPYQVRDARSFLKQAGVKA
ncbi:MAG: type II toxin-antitoxin system HicA family toxin [Proteobacteria bacterium]|nr:type II toxin-antitoxin system HicA family toxin [Pseudomonadota bacterium]MBU1738450.1 type II toxin-antitoxin system HicA family toxin [Pseudomonadota bacterium]